MFQSDFPGNEDQSSIEEEDFRPLTSFKKTPYLYKYSLKHIDNKEPKTDYEPVTIRYKLTGKYGEIVTTPSNHNKHNFSINYTSTNSIQDNLPDNSQSLSGIENNIHIPHLTEQTSGEVNGNNTTINRKYEFSFSSNQTSPRESFSYDEIKKDPFSNSQFQEISNEGFPTQDMSSKNRMEVIPVSTKFVEDPTNEMFLENTSNIILNTTKVEHKKTIILDNELISTSESSIPTTFRGNHNFKNKNISATPENILVQNLRDKSVQTTLRRKSIPLKKPKLTHDHVLNGIPTTPSHSIATKSNSSDESNPSTSGQSNIPIWKSKNRGTFRPKLEDFSSLLSLDIPRQKKPSIENAKRTLGTRPRNNNNKDIIHDTDINPDRDTITQSFRAPLGSVFSSNQKFSITNGSTNTTTTAIKTYNYPDHTNDLVKVIKEEYIQPKKKDSSQTQTKSLDKAIGENIQYNAENIFTQKMHNIEETSQKSSINKEFVKVEDNREQDPNISEIPLFTRRKYYKFLKDSPTVYISTSNKNDRVTNSQYRIKEVFDTSFDLTTSFPNSKRMRTSKKTSNNADSQLEPLPTLNSSPKIKINLLESERYDSTKHSERGSNEQLAHEEDMVTERSSYYDTPDNDVTTTFNEVDESSVSTDESNQLSDINMDTIGVDIKINNFMLDSALTEAGTSNLQTLQGADDTKKISKAINKSTTTSVELTARPYNIGQSQEQQSTNLSDDGILWNDDSLLESSIEESSPPSSDLSKSHKIKKNLELLQEGGMHESNDIFNEYIKHGTEPLPTEYPDIAERSSDLATGSTTESLRTRFPIRNRPTIRYRAKTNETQINESSTVKLNDSVILNSADLFPLDQAISTTTEASTAENVEDSLSTSTTITEANNFYNEVEKTSTTIRSGKRPLSLFYQNRRKNPLKIIALNKTLNAINDSIAIATRTRSSLFTSGNQTKFKLNTNPELTSTISSISINNTAQGENDVSPKSLISRTRPSYISKSSTSHRTDSYIEEKISFDEVKVSNIQKTTLTTRGSIVRPGVNRRRSSTTSTTESVDVISEANINEDSKKSSTPNTKRKTVLLSKKPSDSYVNNLVKFRRREPLIKYTTTSPSIHETYHSEDKDIIEDDQVKNRKGSYPVDEISSLSPTVSEFKGQFSEEGKDENFLNIIRGSQKFQNKTSTDSSTRKYININRNRSKINSRFPGHSIEMSEDKNINDISFEDSISRQDVQKPIRTYRPLKRTHDSNKPTESTVFLDKHGYPIGYKPIGRSKAKSFDDVNSDITLDINDSLKTSTNTDIAYSDISLELNDKPSKISFRNKNSNERFQNKFSRTSTSGTTINTTTNPSPTQVNIELDSENSSTPSSRLKIIKFTIPENNNTFINEFNNTSTSTTITSPENREQNVFIEKAVSEINEDINTIKEKDSEVYETLIVSELRRPFANSVELENTMHYKNPENDNIDNIKNLSNKIDGEKTFEEGTFKPKVEYKKELIASIDQENFEHRVTSEKIPESETAESNDESQTEISEPITTIKAPTLRKILPNKSTSTRKNDKINETKRPDRPFFPKRTKLKTPLEDVFNSEEPMVESSTVRFRRPGFRRPQFASTSDLDLKDSSHEVTTEQNIISSTFTSYKARRPLFPLRRSTTPATIAQSIEKNDDSQQIPENEKTEIKTLKFKKPFLAGRKSFTTNKTPSLESDESSIEETSSEIEHLSQQQKFIVVKKNSSTTEPYIENELRTKIGFPKTFTRKPFRTSGFSSRSTTTSSIQTESLENRDETNISSPRSRFTLPERRFVSTTVSSLHVSQSTRTTEESTSRQPRIFEKKFGRTRLPTNYVTRNGLNNAGVGFIDPKSLSLATRGKAASKIFRSTTFSPDNEKRSEEYDDEEESNEVLNTRPLAKPSGFVRPTIRASLFSKRNKPDVRQPIQNSPDIEDDSNSHEIDSEGEDDYSLPSTSNPTVFHKNKKKSAHRHIENKLFTSQKKGTIGREEAVSPDDAEKDGGQGVRLSNFNSKIYENLNSPPTFVSLTEPTRKIVNIPYAALNKLRPNTNSTTPSTRFVAQRPTNRPRVVNRPLFSSSTLSSLDREQNTQIYYSNNRTFKRKFTTKSPSTPSDSEDYISVDAINNNKNKQFLELTSTKHSSTTTKTTQSTESVSADNNTEPTEDYESTTITATTIPNDIENQTEMDEVFIPFQDDFLYKLDSTVDTSTIPNEEDTTLIDETLTQFQENKNTTPKSPVTTSTEKETTLQHVFAIPVDEKSEITTEMTDLYTDKTVAEKTQEIEDEVKKIINVLTGSGAIKPVIYEEVLIQSGGKNISKESLFKKEEEGFNKNETLEEMLNYNEYNQTSKENEPNNNEKMEYNSDKRDNVTNIQMNSQNMSSHFNDEREITIEDAIVSSTEMKHFEPTEPTKNSQELTSSNLIKNRPLNEVSEEIGVEPTTENNLIKIVTGQTIIFFDDDSDEIRDNIDNGVLQQHEKPIFLETKTTVEDINSEEEKKSFPGTRFYSVKKIPGSRAQDEKSSSEISITKEKYKTLLEEKKTQFRNKFLTQEKVLSKYNQKSPAQFKHDDKDERRIESISEGTIQKGSIDENNKPFDNIFDDMVKEITKIEIKSQERMDDENISEEEKKRLTAERLVEINKIVEVYLKEEQVRYNPKTKEIIRLGEGELKLVRPARTYKLGEISRIKHVSNVQIEGHSSVSGSTLSPPAYKQARNVRLVPSEPIRNALPSDNNRHGKVFVVPDIVRQMQTSTITLEGLFDLNRHGKELNTIYDLEPESITTTTQKSSIPKPLQHVRPISLESDPLVISIANLDQVVLSKLHKDDGQ